MGPQLNTTALHSYLDCCPGPDVGPSLVIRGRRNVAVDSGAVTFLRDFFVALRRRVVASMHYDGRRWHAMKRMRINRRAVYRAGVVEERGRLVNPAAGLLRVAVNACDHFCGALRNDARDAGTAAFVLNLVRGTADLHVSVRLLTVRFVLNRILRICIARVTRATIRNGVDGVRPLSFGALRRLPKGVRAHDQDNGDPFIFNRGALRALRVVFLKVALRGVFKR